MHEFFIYVKVIGIGDQISSIEFNLDVIAAKYFVNIL